MDDAEDAMYFSDQQMVKQEEHAKEDQVKVKQEPVEADHDKFKQEPDAEDQVEFKQEPDGADVEMDSDSGTICEGEEENQEEDNSEEDDAPPMTKWKQNKDAPLSVGSSTKCHFKFVARADMQLRGR